MKNVTACRVSAALWLAASLVAQRAPFTGTLTGLDRKPLANAQVVCAWQPGLAPEGPPDRCEVKTDAEGRFACELVPGRAYLVWAIGPAGADGAREVVLPSAQGAAGKQMHLRAGMRTAPVSLEITGTSPWIAEGPLAVRIGVADRIALGPDVAIPGDGKIVLPPLPTDQIQVALVDGRGGLLGLHRIDTNVATAGAFAEPREFDALVEDDAGAPIAGVQLLSNAHELLPPVKGEAWKRDARVVATTDDKGRAHCRMASAGNVLFVFAEQSGRAGAVSGWFGSGRFENGKESVDDGDADRPLHFVLAPREPTSVRLVGAEARDELAVRFTGSAWIRWRNREVGWPQTFATSGKDGSYTCEGSTGSGTVSAYVAVRRAQDVPHMTIAFVHGTERNLPDIDLRALRTFDVRLADAAGTAVPCGHVAVAEPGAIDTLGAIVSDAKGRAEVRIADEDLVLFATTGTHCGLAVLPRGVPSGPAPITMRPLATMRLRVVDEKGAPVAGARIEMASMTGAPNKPREDQSPEEHKLECADLALACRHPPSDGRTDPNGEIELRFPDSRATINVRACFGTLKSEPIRRKPGNEPQELVLR